VSVGVRSTRRRLFAGGGYDSRRGRLKADGPETEEPGVFHRSVRAVLSRGNDGVTFIEVTTVVLMIGVLLAIGIPSFLGAKARAHDRSAQSSLRIAITNAKAIYADTDSYAKVTLASLKAAETGVVFTNGPSTKPSVVSMQTGTAGIVFAAESATGTCYVIGDAANAAGTVFGSLGSASCDASTVPPMPTSVPTALHISSGGGWAQAW